MNNQDKFIAHEQTPGTTWLCSFDIGYINFAFYIEEVDKESLESIKNVPLKLRYNDDGTPTMAMQNVLDEVCMNGKTILHTNSNLTKDCVKGKKLDQNIFYNMNDLLDSYGNYWDKCDCFVVEQQMSFGRMKSNPKALKLGHHCQSYFMFRYGRFKEVIEFPAYHKTQVLGCAKIRGKKCKNGKYRWKSIDKPARKKWAVVKATELLTARGEEDTIENIRTKVKKDDLADTFMQLMGYKYLRYVDKSV